MGEFTFGGLSGSLKKVIEDYRVLTGPDEIPQKELKRRSLYVEELQLLRPAALVDRLYRLATDELPERQSELGGPQSGVQWEYAVLVNAIHEAIEAKELSPAEVKKQLREAWELVSTSFKE